MASPTQWTWVWENSGIWWWTGKPGVLQSMGWKRVRQEWTTELNWVDVCHKASSYNKICCKNTAQQNRTLHQHHSPPYPTPSGAEDSPTIIDQSAKGMGSRWANTLGSSHVTPQTWTQSSCWCKACWEWNLQLGGCAHDEHIVGSQQSLPKGHLPVPRLYRTKMNTTIHSS